MAATMAFDQEAQKAIWRSGKLAAAKCTPPSGRAAAMLSRIRAGRPHGYERRRDCGWGEWNSRQIRNMGAKS